MKLEILGSGCKKCKTLFDTVSEATESLSGDYEIVKVEDYAQIMAYGVVNTPALVVDGVVKSSGKLLSVDEVKAFLQA